MLKLHPILKFQFCYMTSPFRVTGHFETSEPSDPPPKKNEIETKRLNVLHIYITTAPPPPSTKFQSVLLYRQPFSSYTPYRDKFTKWTQNDNVKLNTKRSKVPHMHIATTSEPRFCHSFFFVYDQSFPSNMAPNELKKTLLRAILKPPRFFWIEFLNK